MEKLNFDFLKKILLSIYNSTGHNLLLQNAIKGNLDSQYNLAIFYLYDIKNYVEAYAWAEVAYYRNHPFARDVKLAAQEKLSHNQINKAWEKARAYKMNFC